MFGAPDANSRILALQQRKNGACELLKLLIEKYLPLRDLDLWEQSPGEFIENYDETAILNDYDIEAQCQSQLLAFVLCEKLVQNFYKPCMQLINAQIASYLRGELQIGDPFIEDALLNLICIVVRVEKENEIKVSERLPVDQVLNFISQNKFSSPVFQRRFLLILHQWSKIMPMEYFLKYWGQLLQFIKDCRDPVLSYEGLLCLH